MSGYYYSREPGAEGQILTGEGPAPGASLDTLLEREHPPLRVALEVGSALADLLCIAAEDRAVHGDIRPAHIKIDDRGLVSIEGYGIQRRATRAPEGRTDSPPADIYGLGIVLHSMMSTEALGNLPKDPDAHDDEVVSRVLAMDFQAVQGKRWLEDVRRFLCQILAFNQDDRPLPLDAANVLASVAGQCPGEGLESWAQRVSRARPSPQKAAAPKPPPAPDPEEDLGGPVSVGGGFMAKKPGGGARQAPAAKGESTAFWSREKIAAMLAEEDDEDEPAPPPPRRQKVDIPKPQAAAQPARPAPAPEPVAKPRPAPEPVAKPRPAPEPLPEAETVRSKPAIASGNASPFAGAKIERSPVADEEPADEPPKKSNTMMFVGIGVVLLVLVCGGFLALGGGYWFMAGDAPAVEEKPDAKVDEKKPEEAPPAEDAAPTEEAAPAATPAAKPSTPKPAGSSTPKASTPKATAPAPAPKPAPAAAAAAPATPVATGGFTVKFATPGREGRLQCGDGQTAEFAGATTMTFAATTTCLVRIDQGKGAVQVSKTASVTCSEDAGKVTCSGG